MSLQNALCNFHFSNAPKMTASSFATGENCSSGAQTRPTGEFWARRPGPPQGSETRAQREAGFEARETASRERSSNCPGRYSVSTPPRASSAPALACSWGMEPDFTPRAGLAVGARGSPRPFRPRPGPAPACTSTPSPEAE